jgi:hypothetical protein
MTDEEGRAGVEISTGFGGTPSQDWRMKQVTVSAPGWVPVSFKSGFSDGNVARLLVRGRKIAGRCVDRRGRGVGGVELRLRGHRWRQPDLTLVTDEAGRFATDQAPPCESTLTVVDEELISRPVTVIAPDESLEVVACRTARLRGRVVFRSGPRLTALSLPRYLEVEPPAGARVRGLDDDGGFLVETPPGPVALTWGGETLQEFDLRSGDTVAGLVYEVAFGPPPPPSWSPSSTTPVTTPLPESIRLLVSGITGDDFRIVRVADCGGPIEMKETPNRDGSPCEVRVGVQHEGWIAVLRYDRAALREAPFSGLVKFDLSRTGVLAGEVLDETGAPVGEGTVRLRLPGTRLGGPRGDLSGFAGQGAGEFEVRGVGPGRFDLVYESRFLFQPVVLRRGVTMGDGPHLLGLARLRLDRRPEPLTVLVRGPEDEPVGGAVVRLDAGSPPVAVRTDESGLAVIDVRDPTDLTVTATAPGRGTARERLGTDSLPRTVTLRLR